MSEDARAIDDDVNGAAVHKSSGADRAVRQWVADSTTCAVASTNASEYGGPTSCRLAGTAASVGIGWAVHGTPAALNGVT